MSDLQTPNGFHLSRLKRLQARQLQPKLDPRGVLLVILSAAGFSTLAIFGKLAYASGLDPLSTVSWRLGGAAAVLWLWMLWKRQWRVPVATAIAAFLLGALGYSLQSALFFTALTQASAGVTALMFYTYPACVALFSWAFLRTPICSWQVKALALALLGTVLTVDLSSGATSLLGIALGIGAGEVYAVYMMLSARLVRKVTPLVAAAYMLLGATVTIASWATVQQGIMLPATSGAIVAAAGLAIVSTALPIGCLFAGLQRLHVIPAAILSTLEPVLAVVMGIVLLGEHLWLGQIVGGAFIVGSALMLQAKLSRGR